MARSPQVNTTFGDIIETLAAGIASSVQEVLAKNQFSWTSPGDWDESLKGDFEENLRGVFDRNGLLSLWKSVIQEPENGTIGDMIAIILQQDYMSVMHRAFSNRHQTRCRTAAYKAARMQCQGGDTGVFNVIIKGSILRILR